MPQFKQIPLFGGGIRSTSPFITAQRRVNVYYDARIDKDKTEAVLINRPGLTILLTLPTNPIRGMIQDGTFAFVVAGSVLYMISPSGGYCIVGNLTSASGTPVSMAFNETQLGIVDGTYGYCLNNVPGLEDLATNNDPVQQAQVLADWQFIRDIQAQNIA